MDPSKWPAQDPHRPSPADPNPSAQNLLSTYPFASTTPVNNVAQHVSSASQSASHARPPPSFLYPQYYQQPAHADAYAEYDRGMSVLQSGGTSGGAEAAYLGEQRQRAMGLLVQEQQGMAHASYVPRGQVQTPAQQFQQQQYSYPPHQPNSFAAPLVQNFPYPQQPSLQQPSYPQYYSQQPQPQQTYPQNAYNSPRVQHSQVHQNASPVHPPHQEYSSLANAIPRPTKKPTPAPPPPAPPPPPPRAAASSAPEYFNGFLKETTTTLAAQAHSTSASQPPSAAPTPPAPARRQPPKPPAPRRSTGGVAPPSLNISDRPAHPRPIQPRPITPPRTNPGGGTFGQFPVSQVAATAEGKEKEKGKAGKKKEVDGQHQQQVYAKKVHSDEPWNSPPKSQPAAWSGANSTILPGQGAFQVVSQKAASGAPGAFSGQGMFQVMSQGSVSNGFTTVAANGAPQTTVQKLANMYNMVPPASASQPTSQPVPARPHVPSHSSSTQVHSTSSQFSLPFTPQKPKQPLVPPSTSPDPLLLGPLQFRITNSPLAAQSERTVVPTAPPRRPEPLSPLKRKVPDSAPDELDLFGSPMKKRAEGSVVVVPETPRQGKSTTMKNPLTSTSPVSQSSTQPPSTSPKVGRLVPYVLAPPLPPGARLSSQPKPPPQDEDYHSPSEEEDEDDESVGARGRHSGVKTSGKRTGERDERAMTEKLVSYLEDIFEAEDTLPVASRPTTPDPVSSSPTVGGPSSSAAFFSAHSTSESPQLAQPVMRKLMRYVEACSSDRARSRRRKNKGGGLTEIDVGLLTRILRILERSVKAAVDVEPFPPVSVARATTKTAKGKGKQKRPPLSSKKSTTATPSRSKAPSLSPSDEHKRSLSRGGSEQASLSNPDGESQGADGESTNVDIEEEEGEEDLSDVAVGKCADALEIASDGVLAADCCLALLTADALPKQLYSEDLIKGCLDVVKSALENVLYPLVEAGPANSNHLSLIHHILSLPTQSTSAQHVASTYQTVLSILPRVDALISAGEHAMSESIVINAIYISIGPFFVVDNTTSGEDTKKSKSKAKEKEVAGGILGGKAGFRALRLEALSVIRSIFANHSDQRSWIIEEILTSLIKLPDMKRKGGQFRLRNGKTIHTVTALLLQLVQTTAHELRISARRLNKNRGVESATSSQQTDGADDGELLTENDLEEVKLYKSGLDQANACARSILMFLVNRSGKNKTTKDSNEAEYRTILDNLVGDLLTVLYVPEWPAASLLLRVACRLMMSSLEDIKSTTDNALKQLSLDHLGNIAAHLRGITLKAKMSDDPRAKKLKPLDEIVMSFSVQQFKALDSAHKEVCTFLARRAAEDPACYTAKELLSAMWGYDVANTLGQCSDALDANTSISAEKHDKGVDLVQRMKLALQTLWKVEAGDVFDAGDDSDGSHVEALVLLLGATNSLQNAFEAILNAILSSLGSAAVFIRTKALRALAQIVTCDPDILRHPNVRQSIESHLADSSSAVREAAIELIGKYIVQEPTLLGDYYAQLSDRIADTGLGVRKRVMKLLRTLYDVVPDSSKRTDICVKLIFRLQDEDDTVKDLAVKSLEEMWFSQSPITCTRNGKTVSDDVSVFMNVVGLFRDKGSLIEDLLRQILSGKEGKDHSGIIQRYGALCDALIDRLVDAQEDTSFSTSNCIRGIHFLATSHHSAISGSKAEILLPYLRPATTAEEQAVADSLLRVFRAAIPGMPKTAVKFGEDLQSVLLPMISKPPAVGGLPALHETVACLCCVVHHLTHDYARLVGLLKSCNLKLQAECKSTTNSSVNLRALPLLMFIAALLNEHCDFDRIRSENPSVAGPLNSITTGSVSENIYETFLTLYGAKRDASLSAVALQCLGILFKAYPKLMTNESTFALLDGVFESKDDEVRGRVLKILQEFMASEAAKRSEEERVYKKASKKGDVDMDELVGSSNTFADSGVSSTVIQRYLRQILDGALSTYLPTQKFAVEILSFTVKQGLAHPLQCLPVLVALETSPDASLSARAGTLHAVLQNKHASLLNSRFLDSARKSFEYQVRIASGPVQGCRLEPAPVALLHRWYTLVRDKRAPRQELLKAIVKAFDVDSTKLACTTDEVAFIRYMAENVSALEYKTLEEILTVIKSLTAALSVAGMQLVDTLSRLDLDEQLDTMNIDGVLPIPSAANGTTLIRLDDPYPVLRASVAVGVILLLKAHLKTLYGLSEDKCLKFVLGKKSNIGDRTAVRKNDNRMSYERLPFATSSLLTMDDLRSQRKRFLELWGEDGVQADPQDDMDFVE